MLDGVSVTNLDSLIGAVLLGRPYDQRVLKAQAKLYARRLCRAVAKGLPEDLHDDVLNQAFVQVMRVGPASLSLRSGREIFRDAVLSAIRTVRAGLTEPGLRTRHRNARRPSPKEVHQPVAAEHVGQIVDAKALARAFSGEGPERFLDFDLMPSAAAAAEQRLADDRLETRAILARATPVVRLAMNKIHLDGEPLEDVAKHLDVSRFVLNRRIKSFCAECRAAAA